MLPTFWEPFLMAPSFLTVAASSLTLLRPDTRGSQWEE